MKAKTLLIIFLSPTFLMAQLKTPEVPTFKTFVPLEINSGPSGTNTQMGMRAGDIIGQQNARNRQLMGIQPLVIPPTDPLIHKRQNAQAQQMREILQDLNEVRSDDAARRNANYYDTEKFKAENASYWKAKEILGNMLAGNTPLSLKDAFYSIENAYGNTHLSYDEYNATLKKSAQFIQQWLNENGHNPSDNKALHFGIQSFMKDTLTVSKINIEPSGVSKTKHVPFTYDYIDFRPEEDFRNYFVTKTLATGSGQCNSLPTAYLLLAEQLGAKTYLSYAPLHSFIKFPDNNGNIHNYEPTSHFEISDQWYAQHLNISRTAYQSKIYLDTLNKKQIVAGALMDLAFGYLNKHGVADGDFMDQCVREALPYFPGKVANVQGWLLRSALVTSKLHHILEDSGIRDLKDINKSPEAAEAYNQLLIIQQVLNELGYEEMPTTLYENLMQQQEIKGRTQKETQDTKTKRDLFFTFK